MMPMHCIAIWWRFQATPYDLVPQQVTSVGNHIAIIASRNLRLWRQSLLLQELVVISSSSNLDVDGCSWVVMMVFMQVEMAIVVWQLGLSQLRCYQCDSALELKRFVIQAFREVVGVGFESLDLIHFGVIGIVFGFKSRPMDQLGFPGLLLECIT